MMGGYKPKRRIFNLSFEDHPGLEVRTKGANAGQFLEIVSLAARLQNFEGEKSDLTDEDVQAISKLFKLFSKVLKSWNLRDEDDDGNDIDVPPTYEGMMSQELDLVMEIISGWIDAVGGVSKDLGKDSSSGGTSQEVTLPMDRL